VPPPVLQSKVAQPGKYAAESGKTAKDLMAPLKTVCQISLSVAENFAGLPLIE